MRIYQKISESNDKAIYEYLWGDYTKPFTGIIEINKQKHSASVIRVADGDHRPKYAGAYALICLPKENYPKRRTHTAP